jgi:acyl-CoA reductase-like NAD-dependent aldehyde dehydrogenase
MALLEPVDGPRVLHGRRRLEVRNPATLERIGEIEVATDEDVRAAVARAREAAAEWGELPFETRARHLLRLRDRIVERAEDVVDVICRDTGKPRIEAYATELLASCDAITFYARRARRWLRDEKHKLHLMRHKRLRISYRPLGVVGLITPWNFPFVLTLNPIAQALMAGNAVVVKPSEITPFVGQLCGELAREAGLPEHLLQVVTGDGSTGSALVEARCDKICFTGSVRTGRQVAEACGRRLIPCTLELGGKDPMIVCEDANLDRAASGAVYGAFANSGQICVSVERVYVHRSVASPFVEKVVALTERLRQGPETRGEVDVGAITSPAQIEIIERHVADAVARGARVRAGGRRNPNFAGCFYEPTVLTDVDHTMAVMREETFGPVLPIQVVESEDEAVGLSNETPYGLNASVFTRDVGRGTELAARIRAGSVVINDCLITYGIAESPFGGVKDSGIGRVNGELGLRSFCHAQTLVSDRFRGRGDLLGYPYSEGKLRTARRLLTLLYRTPLGRLLGG